MNGVYVMFVHPPVRKIIHPLMLVAGNEITITYQGPELQCLLKVKEDLRIDISTCYIRC